MLPAADDLLMLMKQQTDLLVADDPDLQTFLTWVDKKTISVEAFYKPLVIRALYFSRARAVDFSCGITRTLNLATSLALDLDLDLEVNFDLGFGVDPHLLAAGQAAKNEPELELEIKALKAQLPNSKDHNASRQW